MNARTKQEIYNRCRSQSSNRFGFLFSYFKNLKADGAIWIIRNNPEMHLEYVRAATESHAPVEEFSKSVMAPCMNAYTVKKDEMIIPQTT